jgi:ankyrin repeat protein
VEPYHAALFPVPELNPDAHEPVAELRKASGCFRWFVVTDARSCVHDFKLHGAAWNGCADMVRLLLRTRAVERLNKLDPEYDWSVLEMAVIGGDAETLKVLLASDALDRNLVTRVGEGGQTLLHWAASHGTVGLIRTLLGEPKLRKLKGTKTLHGDTAYDMSRDLEKETRMLLKP